MSQIIVGTSGFFYKDWKGIFYPLGTEQNDFLEYYSRHFSGVELNFSYYRLPEAKYSRNLIKKSKKKLGFSIKAFRGMTHDISQDSMGSITDLFLDGINPFMEEGLLGAILLQFPQSFHYTPSNRRYLKSLINRLAAYPLVVEFRQKEWIRESVFKTLKDLKTGFVCVDEPSLPSLIPPIFKYTSNLGYIRFHGRNKRNWYGTDSTRRYDYLYSEEELYEWVPRIKEIAGHVDKLYVFFNNHAKAQAPNNAQMLIKLLE
ncbi:MAG: DUF72 domain-containing protein [Deltaproteobacteria bacterium]|nr:DUF72 domain-containing protein [Deltaproteobacteria bacterium]